MSELKPCPFCGSIPEVYDSETDDIREEDAHWVSVCCRKCGAEPFRHIYSDNVNEDTKQAYRDKCISKWNTRTRTERNGLNQEGGFMNSNELDGKMVDQIIFPNGEVLSVNEEMRLRYHYEFHGEYDDAWVIQVDNVGNETARHNVKFIESIIWSN